MHPPKAALDSSRINSADGSTRIRRDAFSVAEPLRTAPLTDILYPGYVEEKPSDVLEGQVRSSGVRVTQWSPEVLDASSLGGVFNTESRPRHQQGRWLSDLSPRKGPQAVVAQTSLRSTAASAAARWLAQRSPSRASAALSGGKDEASPRSHALGAVGIRGDRAGWRAEMALTTPSSKRIGRQASFSALGDPLPGQVPNLATDSEPWAVRRSSAPSLVDYASDGTSVAAPMNDSHSIARVVRS